MEGQGWPERFHLFHPIERIKAVGHFLLDRYYYDVPHVLPAPEPEQPQLPFVMNHRLSVSDPGYSAEIQTEWDRQRTYETPLRQVPDVAGRDVSGAS